MLYFFQFNSGSLIDYSQSKCYRFLSKREVLFYNGDNDYGCANYLSQGFVLKKGEYGLWEPDFYWSKIE